MTWFQVESKGEGSRLPSDFLEAHLMKYQISSSLGDLGLLFAVSSNTPAGYLQGHQTNNQTIYNLAPGTVPPKAPGHQSVGSSRCRLEDAKVGEPDIGEVPPPSSELHPPHLLAGTSKVSQLQIGIFYQLNFKFRLERVFYFHITSNLPAYPVLLLLSGLVFRLRLG